MCIVLAIELCDAGQGFLSATTRQQTLLSLEFTCVLLFPPDIPYYLVVSIGTICAASNDLFLSRLNLPNIQNNCLDLYRYPAMSTKATDHSAASYIQSIRCGFWSHFTAV